MMCLAPGLKAPFKRVENINMKAAVLRKIGDPLIIEDLEIPKLTNSQVLVRLNYSGVCRSQLMEVEGKRGPDKWLPHLLGHEGSGIVEAIGLDVKKVQVGDRVGVSWLASSGNDSTPPSYIKCGCSETINSGKTTTFAEISIVPENRVFKVPKNITLIEAVLFGCAISTGAGMVINESTSQNLSDKILVNGIGGIGLSCLVTLLAYGYNNIVVSDVSDAKLGLAKSLGVKEVVNVKNSKEKLALETLKFDFIYEASGSIEGIEYCFSLLENKGTLLFASHPEHGEKIKIDPHELIKGKKILGSWGGSSQPEKIIAKFSEFKEAKRVDLNLFLGSIYSLDQINEALEDLRQNNSVRPIIKFM